METTTTETTTAGQPQGGSEPNVNTGLSAGDGGASKWQDSLPDTYKGDPVFKNFSSNEDLYKAYKNAASLVGLDKYTIARKPKDDAPAEEWAQFYNSIGRPEDPNGYKLPEIEDAYKPGDDYVKEYRVKAHELGLNEKQFSGMVQFLSERAKAEEQKSVTELMGRANSTKEVLKKEFGEAYTDKINLADRAIKGAGGEPLLKILQETGAITYPEVMKMLALFGKFTGEDSALGSGGGGSPHLTPAEASRQHDAFLSEDKNKKAYMNGEKWAVEKVTMFNKYRFPEDK
jgi:hypothetical protein